MNETKDARDADPLDLPTLIRHSAQYRDRVTNCVERYQAGDQLAGMRVGQVHLIALAKLQRLQEGVEVLLARGLTSESAVLVLTQFELRLDVEYIGYRTDRASKWLGHRGARNSPWPVKAKIQSLYATDATQQQRHEETFRTLSGIKHANPHYQMLAFDNVREKRPGAVTIGFGAARFSDDLDASMAALMSAFAVTQTLKALEILAGNPEASFSESARREVAAWCREAARRQATLASDAVTRMRILATDNPAQ